MATAEQNPTTGVVNLGEDIKSPLKGESLGRDAMRRLFRNRAAMIGLTIIIINFLMALGAGFFAPQNYSIQVLADNNGAPLTVINMFPTMTPRDETFRVGRGAEALVETGDRVQMGDPIVRDTRDDEVALANMDGFIIYEGRDIVLTPAETQSVLLQSGWVPLVAQDQEVLAGDPIIADASGENIQFASMDGNAYLTGENEVVVVSNRRGYVAVREQYPLGADALGRDLLSRIIYGAQVSLLVALVGPIVSLSIGMPYGMIAGYFGGRVDTLMMRFVDTVYAFPTLLLIILLMAFFRSSFSSNEPGTIAFALGELDRNSGGMLFIFIGIGLTSWMQLARLTRGQVLSVREQEYVIAANSIGARTPKIMGAHILPNILGPIIIAETLTIPTYIRYEAFLSFIGLGVNPPTPSWGAMISEGATVIRSYPNQALFPALALFMIMFAFNFLGDGLRDALDPRMRGVG